MSNLSATITGIICGVILGLLLRFVFGYHTNPFEEVILTLVAMVWSKVGDDERS